MPQRRIDLKPQSRLSRQRAYARMRVARSSAPDEKRQTAQDGKQPLRTVRRDTARAMSEENVEILRHYLGIWLEGDLKDLGDLSFLDADCLYEDEILPDHVGETYQGHDGFRKAWARAVEPWESITREVEWIRDAGDSVVSCHSGRVRGKGSGIEATIRYAYVWRFRGEKVVHCKSYGDPAKALEAAGLSE